MGGRVFWSALAGWNEFYPSWIPHLVVDHLVKPALYRQSGSRSFSPAWDLGANSWILTVQDQEDQEANPLPLPLNGVGFCSPKSYQKFFWCVRRTTNPAMIPMLWMYKSSLQRARVAASRQINARIFGGIPRTYKIAMDRNMSRPIRSLWFSICNGGDEPPWKTAAILVFRRVPGYWSRIPGSSKKQPSCQTHCEENCMPPSPNSMLLHRFASKGLQKKQPFRFGCRHALGNNIDQGGAGGSGVMWQHVGGWLFFLKNPGKIFWLMDVQIQSWTISLLHLPKPQSKHTRSFKATTHQTKTKQICFFRLWMCKRKLEQIPFCTCQNPNPNTLSSSELLPTNKEATLQHLLCMWAKIGDQSCVSCAVH